MSDFDQIADEQGWDDQTKLSLLQNFIAETGLSDKLSDWTQKVVDDENAECSSDDEEEIECAACGKRSRPAVGEFLHCSCGALLTTDVE